MMDDLFASPAAAERLRASILGAHLDTFCASLASRGYTRLTTRHKLWIVSCSMRWMTDQHIAVIELDERRVDEFVEARKRSGRTVRGFGHTLRQLLAQLRSLGEIGMPVVVVDESPTTALLARYTGHLRKERGLAESTIAAYQSYAQALVEDYLEAGMAQPSSLRAVDIRNFLLARVRQMGPKRAQFMATALRSFLRFLFLRGETGVDLALAVPMVRQWRLVDVPRHMPAEDVERLLRACDRSSPTGRRNHALLLLIARLGLRASEVMSLEIGDVRWREGEFIVRGKGRVRDRLPLLPDVGEALALYLKDRPRCSSGRVFLCMKAPHRGFSHPSTVSTIVARTLDRAGLTPPTRGAHLLRHSLAIRMVQGGASFAEIGQVLRHRSPATTEIYAKLDFGALRDVALPWPTTGGAP